MSEILTFSDCEEASPEKRAHILATWRRRLEGCERDVEVWQRLLAVHSLVVPPQENLPMWLKFSAIARKSGHLRLCNRYVESRTFRNHSVIFFSFVECALANFRRTLRNLLGISRSPSSQENLDKQSQTLSTRLHIIPENLLFASPVAQVRLVHNSTSVSFTNISVYVHVISVNVCVCESCNIMRRSLASQSCPQVPFAYIKFLWTAGAKEAAVNHLRAFSAVPAVKSDRALLARCCLRLGEWQRQLLEKLNEPAIQQILSYLQNATLQDPTYHKVGISPRYLLTCQQQIEKYSISRPCGI